MACHARTLRENPVYHLDGETDQEGGSVGARKVVDVPREWKGKGEPREMVSLPISGYTPLITLSSKALSH